MKKEDKFTYYNQKLAFLYKTKKFLDDYNKIVKKYFIKGKPKTGTKQNFEKEIINFLKKYNLPLSFNLAININNPMVLKHGKGGSFIPDRTLKRVTIINEGDRLLLDLAPDATIEDIIALHKKIKKEQKKLPGYIEEKTKLMTDFERNLRIWELKQKGKKAKEIMTIVNKEFSKKGLGYNQITDKISKVRKKFNIA